MTVIVPIRAHHALCVLAVLMASLLFAGPARADKLDDFKKAAQSKYCDSIPYSSERSRCNTLSSDKDRVCRDFACPLDDFEKKVQTLAAKKKNLEEARSRKNESAAKDLEKAIADLEAKLGRMKDEAKPKVTQAEGCGKARKAVQSHFESVHQKVQGEREEGLQTYVRKLVEHYVAEKKGHETAIQEVSRAHQKCETMLKMRY